MHTTNELLTAALDRHNAAFWAREMGVKPNTFAMAKKRGRLSPTMAGALARFIGEPVEHWISVAALEAEPESQEKTRLSNMLGAGVRGAVKRCILTLQILAENWPRSADPRMVWALMFVNNPVNHYGINVVKA